ncbi:uncharacterized protein B0T23DRAFT_402111 [Neurospora hispaniola]|uniref:Uncharacterized protein n=1 Tax=Neurospora hispaniola TaxID=588809 RepID=A0AAJ0MTT0_9PEZI|nr:hypothetical protein B0T23DRAFT_402111 [Neurospora hispaniola]
MECANKTPTEKSCCQSFCRQRANTSGHLGRGVAGLVRLRRTGTGARPKGASIGISVLQGFHVDGFQLVQLRLPAFGLRGRARATAAAEEELEGVFLWPVHAIDLLPYKHGHRCAILHDSNFQVHLNQGTQSCHLQCIALAIGFAHFAG